MISALRAIIGAIEALPMLRTLLIDVVRMLKHYESQKRYNDKMLMVDDAISDVEHRLRESQEREHKDTY